MFVVDLECENGHEFEGWYDSRSEYEQIRADDELTCPLCETHAVRNKLSTGDPVTAKRADKQQREKIRYVSNFADEAIAMHRGEKAWEPIIGPGTEEQKARLDEAGVPYGEVRVVLEDDEPPDPTEIN